MAWKLALLGRAHLTREGVVVRLERKTAALFAYLALEGPTPRSRLAGLLWPDSLEDAARSSLRQRLYRLRAGTGTDLIVSEEPLRLDPALEVDAVRLESLVFTGEHAGALELEGGLLEGNDYDDCPDLAEWVLAVRERLEGLRREALGAEANRLEAASDYATALGFAERLLARDPVSEDGHRRVMRLHYLAGDRPAAIRAFERCRAVLEAELGVEPLAETLQLARLIARGDGLPQTAPPARASIPLQVLRPPVLAGREREWAQLTAAWDAGLGVVVRGEAGVGKTRLMLDFVSARGAHLPLEGRSGDAGVPYAALARGLRRALERHATLDLEPWVRRELSRLLPELEPDAPPAMASEAETLRFLEAVVALLEGLGARGVRAVMADDLHFMDAASLEAWRYVAGRLAPGNGEGVGLRTYGGLRAGELEPDIEAGFLRAARDGGAVLIELGPLHAEGVSALLNGLELPGVTGLAAPLERYTGGNPLYVLETLKSLLETGEIERGLPRHFPPPLKIEGLIGHRLERLSPGALRVARVAAVAGTEFTLELAAAVLETDPLELAEPLGELERAQVLLGERFAHDLILESTRAGIPAPVRALLHRRVAASLERDGASPARIADHWLEAGTKERAVPWLLEAAGRAQAAYRRAEAVDFLERAAGVLEARGARPLAFDVLERLVRLLIELDTGERHVALLERMFALADGPGQLARAWNEKAELLTVLGRPDELARAAQAGLEAARNAADPLLQAQLLEKKAFVLEDEGRLAEALEVYEEVRAILENTDRLEELAATYNNMGFVLGMVGRSRESLLALDRAHDLHPDELTKIRIRHNKAMDLAEHGLIREALDTLEDVLTRLSGRPEETRVRLVSLITAGRVNQFLARYGDALARLEEASTLDPSFQHWRKGDLHRMLGAVFLELGVFEQAELEIERAIHESNLPAGQLGMAWLLRARVLAWTQAPFAAALEHAEALIRSGGDTRQLLHLRFAQAGLLPPGEGLRIALEELELGATRQFDGPQIAARTRAAQALLALERAQEARPHSAEAVLLLERYDSPHIPRAEVLFTHARALAAVGDENALAALERALRWLLEVANDHVLPEHRQGFLTRNPVNAAILEAAQSAGLAPPSSVTPQ